MLLQYFNKWHKKVDIHHFVDQMYEVEKEPAFVPGKVLHIKKTGKRVHRRYVTLYDLCYVVILLLVFSLKPAKFLCI